MLIKQGLKSTVKSELIFSGIGLHSGEKSEIKILPSDSGNIVFSVDGKFILANAKNVTDTSRGTTLSTNNEKIMTVEHLLSALYAFGIDSALIECSSNEIPAMDGSSSEYIKRLEKVEKCHINKEKYIFACDNPIFVNQGDSFIICLPSDNFSIEYYLNYNHAIIGSCNYIFDFSLDEYKSNISDSRTFALEEEINFLRANNLARGGSLDNCIVVYQDHFSVPLRHENELLFHKILDLLGDLSLSTMPLQMRIISNKSGHKLNTELSKKLIDFMQT